MYQAYSVFSATVTTILERNEFRKGRLVLVPGFRELLSNMVEKTQLTSWQLKQVAKAVYIVAKQKAERTVGNNG